MSRASLLFRASVTIGLVATLAACDAPSGALGPRDAGHPSATLVGDSLLTLPTTSPTSTTTSTTMDEPTCRSGYQIAYRSDGTWYCEPIGGGN